MGEESTEPSQGIGHGQVFLQEYFPGEVQYLILVVFPGKEVGTNADQEEDGKKQGENAGQFDPSFILEIDSFPKRFTVFLLSHADSIIVDVGGKNNKFY